MTTLYDAYGRAVDFEALREEQAAPQAVGIRNIYAVEHPEIALTPEKLVGILRTAEMGDPYWYLELAEAMEEKDLHYLAVLGTRKHAVAKLDLSVQAASESAEDLRAADLVRDALLNGDLDLEASLFDVLDAIGKGFSVCEIGWDSEGSEWFPNALKWRDPRWFMFDWISGEHILVRSLRARGQEITPRPGGSHLARNNGFGTLEMRAPGGAEIGIQPATEPLAPFKFVTHVAKAKAGLPVRGGIARIAAWAYLFKNYVLKDWVTFAETYGQPLRVGKYGPGATEQDKTALLRAVANVGTDAAAIIPSSMLIEFVQSRLQASPDLYERLCEFLDKQVTKGVLGQTLTTELPKGSGSRAAAEVHDVIRRDIAEDDAHRLAATLNRDLVRPIVDLNLGPRRRYPRLVLGFPDEEDLERLSNALAPFIDRGLPVEQKTILEKFGLSLPASGAATLHPLTKASEQINPPEEPAAAADAGAEGLFTDVHARAGDGPKHVDAIDRFVEKLRNESDEAMAPIIKPLLARMRKARNYTEIKRDVVRAVEEMDVSQFTDLVARAGMQLNLAGNLGLRIAKRPRQKG